MARTADAHAWRWRQQQDERPVGASYKPQPADPFGLVKSWARAVRWGYLGWFGAIALALVALNTSSQWAMQRIDQPISALTVSGTTEFLPLAEFRQHMLPVTEHRFFQVELAAVKALAEAHPWLQAATVERIYPDALKLHVVEHQPVARFGEQGLISDQGVVFYPSAIDQRLHPLPLLQGADAQAEAMLSMLQRLQQRFLGLPYQVAVLSHSERGAWDVELDNGMAVSLGVTHVAVRAERVARLLQGELADFAHRVARLDARYPNGIAVSWRAPEDALNADKYEHAE